MSFDDYTWENDDDDPMIIVIKRQGQPLMRFFLGEAMEGAGRNRVMAHIRECDQSDWLKAWRDQAEQAIIDKLKY